jgi:hypothetical protein
MKVYVLLAMALVLAVGQSASASFILRFETTAPVLLGVAQFNVNSSNTVSLFLDDTLGLSGPLESNGLVTANLGDLTFLPLGVTLTGAGTILTATPNAAFDGLSTIGAVNGVGTQAVWTAAVDAVSPAVFGSATSFGYSVLLGNFTVNPGSVLGGNGSLMITAPVFGDFALDNVGAIAVSSGTPFAFTAVPEPTSLVLVGIAGVGGLVARYRRRGVASATV